MKVLLLNKRSAKEFSKLEARVDDNEQRNRLLLHSVEENSNTNTDQLVYDVVKRELGISLTPSDITRSHRLGTQGQLNLILDRSYSNLPILGRDKKFSIQKANLRVSISRFPKASHYQDINFCKLKGKNISISESLTPSRYKLLQT